MADCYAPEADDLHRRWLPREIFADIGIADPDPVAAVTAAAAKPELAATVAVEEIAVQLAGIIGAGAGADGKGKSAPKRPPPMMPAVPGAPYHRVPVCGLEGAVYGGGNAVSGGAAVAWPVTPYSPVQWQVASNYGALDYSWPCLMPPPPPGATTKLRSGTGVFLPRANPSRHAPPPAKEVKAPCPRTWPGTGRPVQQPKQGEAAAAGRSQPRPNGTRQQKATTGCPAVALPQDWSYH